MIALTPEASAQLDEFERYYIVQQRPQALRNLGHSLAEASLIILNAPQRLAGTATLSGTGQPGAAMAKAGPLLDCL